MAEPASQPTNQALSSWWKPIVVSWSFLTILPAPRVDVTSRAIGIAIALFPTVGLGLGGALGLLGLVLDRFLPHGPTAVILIGLEAVVTGGLHLDGLMDAADGVLGGWTPPQRLEIMRDSRVGAFGVVAGAIALVSEYACLDPLTGLNRLTTLATALTMARWAMVIAIRFFPTARSSGLGATFHQAAGRWTFVTSSLLAVALAAVLGPIGLAGLLSAMLAAILSAHFFVRRLGGLTGDTYGAIAVLAELLILFVSVGISR